MENNPFITGQIWQGIGSIYGDIESWKVQAVGKPGDVIAASLTNCATNKEIAVTLDAIDTFTFQCELVDGPGVDDTRPDYLDGIDRDLVRHAGGGVWYVSHNCWIQGDYCGAGSVGAANITWLQSEYSGAEIDVVSMDYYTTQVFIRADIAERDELLEAMENYPLFDDESHNQIEMEWEDQALNDYAKNDLLENFALWRNSEGLPEVEDNLLDENFYDAYRQACEACNYRPETEYAGSYIDVDFIQSDFNAAMTGLLK